MVPPHASAEAHTHGEFGSAVHVISGRAIHRWRDELDAEEQERVIPFRA